MFKKLVVASVLISAFGFAQASDHGCQVLLCMANPGGWSKIGECAPPMKKLFKDLAKGKAFPTCTFENGSGQDTGTSNQHYAKNQTASRYFCPSGYLIPDSDDDKPPHCAFNGAVTVYVNGQQANRVWWDSSGGSFSETPK
jgi:hypothetical protein